jgi:hypothetical protein
MKQNTFKIGILVSAISIFSSPVNAQLTVRDEILIAEERNSSPSSSNQDSQGCTYEKEAPGSGGKPTKVCRNPKFNGIRIDACLLAYGACKRKASAEEFCRLQADGYTELNDAGGVPDRPSQTISITNGKIHQTKNKTLAPFSYQLNNDGQLAAFNYIRCRKPGNIADNKPEKDNSTANQPDRDRKRNRNQSTRKNNTPIFKGALDLANTRQFTISVPIGNGKRQDVPIRITESGQLIDPLTNQVAVPIDRSESGNTMGRRIIDNVIQKARIEIGKYRNYSDVEKLQLSLDLYGAIPDVAELIETRLKRAPNINITSNVSMEIASGFITGKYPSYMKDLDGLGIAPLFNRVSREVKNVNDYIDNKIRK